MMSDPHDYPTGGCQRCAALARRACKWAVAAVLFAALSIGLAVGVFLL
jgi:hypothetical protein